MVDERGLTSVSKPLALVVTLVLVAGCGGKTSPSMARSTAPSPGASPSSSTSCRPLVLGFRGQGQSTRGFHGAGREAGQVAERLGDRVVGVRFPSSAGGSTYDSDVAAGVRRADRLIRSACGRVVLVGYSQGAEVVHRVVVGHPHRVALAVLMGDPLRNPADHVPTLTLGTGTLTGRGNAGPGDRFPGVVRAHVLEVCVRGDDVCNAPPAGRIGPASPVHRRAYQGAGAARTVAVRAARIAAGS